MFIPTKMSVTVFLTQFVFSLASPPANAAPAAFRFHRAITSHMVLQAERPAVFGWAAPGATVDISIAAAPAEKQTATANATSGEWRVVMNPRDAKVMPTGVTITATSNGKTISIDDVLYG